MFWVFSLFRLFEISRNKSYGFNYNEGMMDREYFFNWTATELFDEPYFYILLLLLFFTKNIFDLDNFKKSNGLVAIFILYFNFILEFNKDDEVDIKADFDSKNVNLSKEDRD